MSMFLFGFSVCGCVFMVFCFCLANLRKPNNSLYERNVQLLEDQLNIFKERVVEERRLADTLEKIVDRITKRSF